MDDDVDGSRPLVHRIKTRGSVQALVVHDDLLIAGLEGGDIVVYSLDTYELLTSLYAHEASVLGLHLSEDKTLLFSCGVDSLVNIWGTDTFERLYSLHSHHEIGDVFCVAHSSFANTVFWGSQNASIQWYPLREKAAVSSRPSSASSLKHRFFDSLGPGGTVTALPKPVNGHHHAVTGGRNIRIPRSKYRPYAHKSYIYCMLLTKGLFDHDLEEEVLITGGGDGTIKLWSIDGLDHEGLVQLTKFKNPGYSVLSLAFSGSFIYAGLSDGYAHVYNLASRQLVQRLHVQGGDVSTVQVFNGKTLCGTSQGWFKQFNPQFTENGSWFANTGKILASGLAKTDRKDTLISGGNDNTLALWDVTDPAGTMPPATPVGNDDLLRSLGDFVAYRTVADSPRCVTECHEAVQFLRKLFNIFNASTALLPTEDGINPILLAKFQASHASPTANTVLFYGHYDVVDVEYEPGDKKWLADPFKLYPLNGYLHARGVSDNKGPTLAAMYAIADLVQDGKLSCNVTILLEGEEEAGSRGFVDTVRRCRDQIGQADYIILSNSYWLDDHIPCITYGMRGVVHATVSVCSDKPDRHSGMDGKSSQNEPLKDLTVLLGRLTGTNAKDIMLPGFHELRHHITPKERQKYDDVTRALLPGHPEIKNPAAFTDSLIHRWCEPNLTIHRIDVPESKTAVTIPRSAKANLSIRIVPEQSAQKVADDLATFITTHATALKTSNKVFVDITSKADAWLGDLTQEPFRTLEAAITDVWHPNPDQENSQHQPSFLQTNIKVVADSPTSKRSPHRRASSLASKGTFTPENVPKQPLYIREGGSIPVISFLEKEFQAPAAMFPMGQASDNAHLDNERIRLENLYRGRDVLRRVFAEL